MPNEFHSPISDFGFSVDTTKPRIEMYFSLNKNKCFQFLKFNYDHRSLET